MPRIPKRDVVIALPILQVAEIRFNMVIQNTLMFDMFVNKQCNTCMGITDQEDDYMYHVCSVT